MPDAQSISASQITSAAKSAVAKVQGRHKALQQRNIILGFLPPWWWIGLILRNPEINSIEEAQTMAGDVHAGIAAEVPAVRGATPGTIIRDHIIICGFILPPEIQAIE
jgi:hypothetical protein